SFTLGGGHYYNGYRSHAALKGQTPIETPESRGASLESYRWQSHCCGLYENTGRGMNRNSPATARDSGGSGSPRISVNPIQPSTENKSLGSRNEIDFGAESSPSTFSLATLLFRRSPAGRQDSLPACLLRLQPDWIFTSWTLSKGFIRSLEFPFPKLCWRDILHEWFAYR